MEDDTTERPNDPQPGDAGTATQEAATATDAPPSVARRLTRSSNNKVIAGVAGGLGQYVGVDPVLFRLLFIVLALVGGGGILLYLAAWLIVPRSTEPNSPAERALSRAGSVPRWIGIALVVLALVATVAREPLEESMFWRPSILWAVALIGIGIVLLQDQSAPARRADSGVPSAPAPGQATASLGIPALGQQTATAPEPAPSLLERWRENHPPSPLGWFTLAAVLLVVAVAGILHGAGSLDLTAADFPALALLVLGVGLVVGARWGRARWLILLGLPLIPLVLGASLIDLPLRGDVGSFYIRAQSPHELTDAFELLAGTMTLDLTRVAGTEPVEVQGSVVAGELHVLVPRDVPVHVDATLDAGELWLFGRQQDGVDLEVDRVFGDQNVDDGVSLAIEGGVGVISVEWAEPARRRSSGVTSGERKQRTSRPESERRN